MWGKISGVKLPIIIVGVKIGSSNLMGVICSTSLVRGFLSDEIFWSSKPRTTKEPRTGEGHRKVDIWTKFKLQHVIWWPLLFSTDLIN